MYYAEKLIDGVWHYRSTPDGEWTPMNAAQLHAKIAAMQKEPS